MSNDTFYLSDLQDKLSELQAQYGEENVQDIVYHLNVYLTEIMNGKGTKVAQ